MPKYSATLCDGTLVEAEEYFRALERRGVQDLSDDILLWGTRIRIACLLYAPLFAKGHHLEGWPFLKNVLAIRTDSHIGRGSVHGFNP